MEGRVEKIVEELIEWASKLPLTESILDKFDPVYPRLPIFKETHSWMNQLIKYGT